MRKHALIVLVLILTSVGIGRADIYLSTTQTFDVTVTNDTWGLVYYENYSYPELSFTGTWQNTDYSFPWNYSNFGWHGFFTYNYDTGQWNEAHWLLGDDWR